MRPLLTIPLFLLTCPAFAAEPIGVEIWHDEAPAKKTPLPDAETERELNDPQYREKLRFKIVKLAPFIAEHAEATDDLVVLRFHNGVRIPLRLEALPPVFLATSMWDDARRKWTDPKPRHRKSSVHQDARPIEFLGHKLVVEVDGDGFSPWRHTGSLVALEYTTEAAWTAPFAAGAEPVVRRGERIFLDSCQFCHGVRGHGGTLGWDFVEPLAVTEYRSTPDALRLHVNHRVSNAMELGLLMPVPRRLTEDEAKALWAWIDAVAQRE
ncbi:MAG: cytochrome c [Deltaproteobacteria bacterium]